MKYYIFLVLAVLFWSGNFITGRYISTSIEPMQLSFYRWFFVLVLLLPYIFINYKDLILGFKKDSLLLVVFGAFGIAGFNTFLYYGLQTTSATNALLINSSTPIFIILISSIIFRIAITKIQILGVLLSTLGVLYLILKGDINHILELNFTPGDLWILLAALDWAIYSVLLKFKPKDLSSFSFLTITSFIGVMILYIAFILQGYSLEFSFLSNKEVLYSLIYIVIFPSILSFYFWNMATIEIGANKAGQSAHLMPIFGAILAYIFLGEVLEFYHIVGIVLIAIGIYLTMFFKKVK
ncbi:EamA/RhaT family transporter [Arcobacter acticola]|uniref:EamA/RhaT family transporter n=1 Tax=Arcobacter acticola TaxID=1849015 RepID=A0A6M8ENW7_9BACT|nr:DMT family transporter [Arcobacter acticola]QKE29789.1 EamA/RhaT family transporter [Arcobacter acticola]